MDMMKEEFDICPCFTSLLLVDHWPSTHVIPSICKNVQWKRDPTKQGVGQLYSVSDVFISDTYKIMIRILLS